MCSTYDPAQSGQTAFDGTAVEKKTKRKKRRRAAKGGPKKTVFGTRVTRFD